MSVAVPRMRKGKPSGWRPQTTLENLQDIARECGLFIVSYSPGDGYTRYKVLKEDVDYFAGASIFRCDGRKDLVTFLKGYAACLARVREFNAEQVAYEQGG